jgi:hypothetical protein
MRRTLFLLQQPTVIVTLLSPSPAASRRMLQRLQRWTFQPQHPMELSSSFNDDALNQTLVSNSALLRLVRPGMKLDSVALPLGSSKETRTILHWLSVDVGDKESNTGSHSGMQMFAIQALTPRTDLLQESRDRLAEKLVKGEPSAFETLRTLGSALTGRLTTRHYLPRQHERLPLLDLEAPTTSQNFAEPSLGWEAGELKEIVIPAYADEGTTLFTTLNDSPHLTRPVTGVYQLPASRLCIRPLPMAKEDRTLLSPSLIFHSDDMGDDVLRNTDDASTHAVKIGFTGITGRGQLMLLDDDNKDKSESSAVDIRLCSATKASSMFAEAQASLLASSLSELQSKHVLTHHSPHDQTAKRESDPNLNRMDCWVEFRATIRNPKGFLPRQKAGPRTATAPDLPYE